MCIHLDAIDNQPVRADWVHITALVVNYGISNTNVLEIP